LTGNCFCTGRQQSGECAVCKGHLDSFESHRRLARSVEISSRFVVAWTTYMPSW
jgi:hypothetical protein